MGLEEMLITTLDRIRDKIESVIGSNKYWWGVGLWMLIIGGIILLIVSISTAISCYSYCGYITYGLILGILIGLLIGGGVDKMVSLGASNEFLERVKKEIEELKNIIIINTRRE